MRRYSRGFTLVELSITIALIAMIAMVAVPSVTNASRYDLRKQGLSLSTLIRQVYEEAILSGDVHRLVFDAGKETITLQKTEGMVQLEPDRLEVAAKPPIAETALASGLAMAMGAPSAGGEEGGDDIIGGLIASMGLSLPEPSADDDGESGLVAPGFETIETELDLGDTVKIKDVWVDGAGMPESAGTRALFFFPSGETQRAFIHLEAENGDELTLKVHPLNGKTEILPGYVEAPK